MFWSSAAVAVVAQPQEAAAAALAVFCIWKVSICPQTHTPLRSGLAVREERTRVVALLAKSVKRHESLYSIAKAAAAALAVVLECLGRVADQVAVTAERPRVIRACRLLVTKETTEQVPEVLAAAAAAALVPRVQVRQGKAVETAATVRQTASQDQASPTRAAAAAAGIQRVQVDRAAAALVHLVRLVSRVRRILAAAAVVSATRPPLVVMAGLASSSFE